MVVIMGTQDMEYIPPDTMVSIHIPPNIRSPTLEFGPFQLERLISPIKNQLKLDYSPCLPQS
jgi:hypothetical protein